MNTYQVTKDGVAITGALTYMEAIKKINECKRADASAEYSVELFMPVRRDETPNTDSNTEEAENMGRMEALAKHLGIELEEGETLDSYITEDSYTENSFDAEGGTYLVLTDEEADEAADKYIRESLWAFNADFLASNTDLPAEVFSMIQAEKSEDANEVFTTLVTKCGDIHRLISDAVSSDGRGHFLADYDFNESEEGEYFIYRTN